MSDSTLPPDIAKIAEPLLLGYLLQWGLFGALSVQVYIYHLAFPNDPVQRKALVYGVYTFELAQVILLSKMAYQEFAAGFGTFEDLNNVGILWFAVPIMSSIVATVVQTFYAYRIRILAQSNIIPITVVLFSLTQLAGGIAQGVMARQITDFSNFLVKKTLITAGIWNGASALCDVIIAASMTYYVRFTTYFSHSAFISGITQLRLSQRRTNYKPTQQLVQRLIRLILETGTLTAALAIINLMLYLIPDQRSYFQATSAVLGKMYSSTMMIVLNNRIVFSRNDTESTELVSTSTSLRPAFPPLHNITVTREQWSDPEPYKIEDR